MKKTVVFSSLFLLIFGLAMGITVVMPEDAMAYEQCTFACLTYTDCSWEQGPLCPANAYYEYESAECGGGPLNCPYFRDEFVGCCKHLFPDPLYP